MGVGSLSRGSADQYITITLYRQFLHIIKSCPCCGNESRRGLGHCLVDVLIN
jgi:hypothetical protein